MPKIADPVLDKDAANIVVEYERFELRCNATLDTHVYEKLDAP